MHHLRYIVPTVISVTSTALAVSTPEPPPGLENSIRTPQDASSAKFVSPCTVINGEAFCPGLRSPSASERRSGSAESHPHQLPQAPKILPRQDSPGPKVGDPCDTNANCITGSFGLSELFCFTLPNVAITNTCQDSFGPRGPCSSDSTCNQFIQIDGVVCTDGFCSGAPTGTNCSATIECADPLVCWPVFLGPRAPRQKACVQNIPGEAGAPCQGQGDCNDGLFCVLGDSDGDMICEPPQSSD